MLQNLYLEPKVLKRRRDARAHMRNRCTLSESFSHAPVAEILVQSAPGLQSLPWNRFSFLFLSHSLTFISFVLHYEPVHRVAPSVDQNMDSRALSLDPIARWGSI